MNGVGAHDSKVEEMLSDITASSSDLGFSSSPLVTIIVGCYDVSEFLPDGLDSVLKQTYRNLEIILVDDGSTDDTGALCRRLADKDLRIRVLQKENGGLGSARNMGLDHALGAYIWFFDVDDSAELDLVEENVRILESTMAEMVIFGFVAHFEDSSETETITHNEKLIQSNQELRDTYCKDLFFSRHGMGFCWSKFYRRSFIDSNGFRFGSQRIQQDEAFNLQFYPKLNRVYISDQAWYHYSIRSSGNTRSRYIKNRFEIILSIDAAFRRLVSEWGINDQMIIGAIDRRYLSGIWAVVVSNLFHTRCPLSLSERYHVVAEISNHNATNHCLTRLKGHSANMEDRVFQFFLRNNLGALTLCYGWARSSFNRVRKRLRAVSPSRSVAEDQKKHSAIQNGTSNGVEK